MLFQYNAQSYTLVLVFNYAEIVTFNLVLVLITKISKRLLKALLVLVNHLFRDFNISLVLVFTYQTKTVITTVLVLITKMKYALLFLVLVLVN